MRCKVLGLQCYGAVEIGSVKGLTLGHIKTVLGKM